MIETHARVLTAIQAELWAITPEALHQVIAIAQGFGESPEAVAAKLGRPLDNTQTVTRRGNAAIVPITGPIFRYANIFTQVSGATSVQTLATDFTEAVRDPTVKAIVLEVDSPGGMMAGVSEFAGMVRDATRVKPVIAYASHMATSAAYWIAAAASEIVVADTALLGSIGVVSRASLRKDDGTVEIVSSQSPNKRLDPGTDEGRARYQAQVDALAQVFVDAMAQYRGVSVDTVLSDFGQGGVLVGADAVKAGMADRVGSLEAVLRRF